MIQPQDQAGGDAPINPVHQKPSGEPYGGDAQQIAQFPVPAKAQIIPVANHLLLDYQKPSMAGQLHLPAKLKQLDTIVVKVLAVGPDVKAIKVGQKILILSKALVGGPDGLNVDGRTVFLTQEQVVIAIVSD